MRKIFFFFPLLFSACGIELPTSTIPLFAPNGLVVTYNPVSGQEAYTVRFDGLNPENNFSGYNLYYTTDLVQAELGQGQRVVLIGALNNDDPTFIVSAPFYDISNFTYVLDRNSMSNNFFPPATPSDFYFFVRAYEQSSRRESFSSLPFRTEIIRP